MIALSSIDTFQYSRKCHLFDGLPVLRIANGVMYVLPTFPGPSSCDREVFRIGSTE